MPNTDDHSHLPSEMRISSESMARLDAAADIQAKPDARLSVIDSCIEHEKHLGELQGALELLEYRREVMRLSPECTDEALRANATLIQDVALKLHAGHKPSRPQSSTAATLAETPRPSRSGRRRSRSW